MVTATYDPADDKIRLSASQRLDADTYARVKAAGYGWAPKQSVFYAVWSPRREDLAIELAGEIGDEDTTLVDRAEQRADRFNDYKLKRSEDAERAHAAVDRIADGIPMGQPILVGHHSERHARRDAEKIENGMRKAVKMWETSKYWESRAAGAIAHAKYKELPAVRARRIKTIEAEMRSLIADYTPHEGVPTIMQTRWDWKPTSYELPVEEIDAQRKAASVPHVWVGPKGRGGRWVPADSLERTKAAHARSIAHCEMRLIYERAMLAEGGGLKADQFDIQVGGQIRQRGEWMVVTKLNRKDGALLSVSVIGYWGTVPIEDVQEYRAPAEGDGEKVKAATKLPPLCNFQGEGFRECTKAELKTRYSFIRVFRATETHGAYRAYCRLKGGNGLDCHNDVQVFLTDVKAKTAPAPAGNLRSELPARALEVATERPVYRAPEPTKFDALKETLKSGVQVVSAPQLFPTPKELAARMVALSGVRPGDTVLEPSAGTGAIVRAVIDAVDTEIVGYEISRDLTAHLGRTFPSYKLQARCCDFLDVTDGQGQFPVVLMNPPFENASDIKHIRHARKFLRPGGVLVAICANGPRQREALMSECEHWEDLPAGTFAESGTNVNTALLVMRA